MLSIRLNRFHQISTMFHYLNGTDTLLQRLFHLYTSRVREKVQVQVHSVHKEARALRVKQDIIIFKAKSRLQSLPLVSGMRNSFQIKTKQQNTSTLIHTCSKEIVRRNDEIEFELDKVTRNPSTNDLVIFSKLDRHAKFSCVSSWQECKTIGS